MKKALTLLSVFVLTLSAFAGKKVYRWDFVNDYQAAYDSVLSKKGMTVEGLTLFAVNKDVETSFAAASDKGLQMYNYLLTQDGTEYNTRYIKLTLPAGSVDSLHWNFREGSTSNRCWNVYYKVMDAGTPVTSSLLTGATMFAKFYSLNTGKTASVREDQPGFKLDFSKKTVDQDVYFFFLVYDDEACTVYRKNNNLAFRQLDLIMETEEVNTKIKSMDLNGLTFPVDAKKIYVDASLETATLTAVPEDPTCTIEPVTFDVPSQGKTTDVTVTVVPTKGVAKDYTYTVVSAALKKTTFDYCLLDNEARQTEILKGKVYTMGNLSMKLIPGTSNNNFGDNSKPGLYIRNAGTTYGDCGLQLTVPANQVGYIELTMRPGNANKTYPFYYLQANAGAAMPTSWSTQKDNPLCSFTSGASTSEIFNLKSCILSTPEENASDFYFFQTYGGLRWQYVTYVQFITDPYEIVDGTDYVVPQDFVSNVNYTRTYSGKWQALHVPFAIPATVWSSGYEIAEPTSIADNVLTITKLENTAATEAHGIYFIKAKSAGEATMAIPTATLKESVESVKVLNDYTFYGTYQSIAKSDWNAAWYAMGTENNLVQTDQVELIGEDILLKAQRWYLELPAPEAKALSISVDGETGIEAIHNAEFIIHNDGKFLQDGRIVIVKNNAKFNVAGQRVK